MNQRKPDSAKDTATADKIKKSDSFNILYSPGALTLPAEPPKPIGVLSNGNWVQFNAKKIMESSRQFQTDTRKNLLEITFTATTTAV
ncbi:hypothetical protein [Microbulbifer sp. TYP-18]|uniref:hypothetical protein n=1 Tax=Microbulbifer sp. TYP-18 TaxID=3230024 RepID=UPI0034C69ED1